MTQTPTTQLELLATAIEAASKGDIDTVERMFDVVTGWVLNPVDRETINVALAQLCAIADMVRP